MFKIIKENISLILFVVGLLFIVCAGYFLNVVVGLVLSGASFLLLAFILRPSGDS